LGAFEEEEEFSIYDNGIQSFSTHIHDIEVAEEEPDLDSTIARRQMKPPTTTPTFVRRG
jgi:hypothetical protein